MKSGGHSVSTPGYAIFTERLTRFAADVDDPAVHAVAARAGADVTVVVHGRPGIGRGTVARALAGAGVSVAEDGDVDVHVVAEVVKPEDQAAIAASGRPSLLVLNKADLVSGARALCACYRGLTGVATVPMAAHLADVQVDDELIRMLVSGAPSQRLLDTLDTYGIAHALPALRAGADAAALRRVLRARSGVDGAVAALAPLLAEVRYRRVRSARAALVAVAVCDDRVEAFLRDDDTVIACMAAAVDMIEAVGLIVDPADDQESHLRRAARWQRYRRGPVNAVHRACGEDIARGSLRLWRRAAS
jgi:ribosomal protein S11